jgi:outer membrane protein insertion porin family
MRVLANSLKTIAAAAAFMTIAPAGGTILGIVGMGIAVAQSSQIVVKGNQRVETDTVRAYVSGKSGRSFTAKDIDESLKALYATGLFSDVQIQQSGGQLIVTVVESPLINKVAFEGNKRITKEQLGLIVETKPRSFLSKSKVQSDTQRLLEAYRRSGRFRASVEPKIIQLPENRVDLVYEIDEGDKTAVSRISFTGNKAFSDGRLRDVVKTRETGLLGFLRTTDTYDPDRLNADQELIRKFYLRNGYADMRVVAATADLDRERNVFFVSFTVDEGDYYTVGAVDVQSTLPGLDGGELLKAVRTKTGAAYNSEEIEKSMEDLVLEASRQGAPFAQIRPRAVRDYATKQIALTYYVDEGQRVYVERINVRGNDRTRDYVIRREIELSEGDAYNRAFVTKAERRLNRLGFFKSVKVTTEAGSTPDRVVMNVDVEEQSSGEISFGAGYSTSDGVIGDVSIQERNFLGRGQFVKASVQSGSSQRGYSFSFTEPYFTGRRISAGFDVYSNRYGETNFRNYTENTVGGGVRLGFPITDSFAIGVSYSVFRQEISLTRSQANGNLSDGEASLAYKQYISKGTGGSIIAPCLTSSNCSNTAITSMPSVNLIYNTLDNVQFPRDGIYGKFQTDFAGVGGDNQYLRFTAEGRYYRELNAEYGAVGMLRVKAGYITGVGQQVPLINNFYIGGETVRGFASAGIGPRDVSRIANGSNPFNLSEALGGQSYVAATAEVTAPLPFTPEEFGLYVSAFADAGSTFGVSNEIKALSGTCINSLSTCDKFSFVDDAAIRSSVGVGVVWRSPFGPLRADFGFALTKGEGDKLQVFRFSGGTQF